MKRSWRKVLSPLRASSWLYATTSSAKSTPPIWRLCSSRLVPQAAYISCSPPNVFVGALRALALGLAASTDVVLRMSRREAVFARALVQALDDEEVAGMIRFTDHVQPEPGDEVHLYGHDATMREIAADLPAGVKVRPHGSGLGIAAVGASAVLKDAARALASDVVPFDQRGCLSPRVVVVEGALERARGFASPVG